MIDENLRRDSLNVMLRLWWVVAASVAVGIAASFLALLVIPQTYTATATQLVKGIPGTGAGADYMAAQFAESRARSYPAFIASRTVLEGVREDLGSQYTDAVLRERLSSNNPDGTPLVRVTATARSAPEARDLANSAARRLARFITYIEGVDGRSPVEVEMAVAAGLPAYASFPSKTLFVAMGTATGSAVGVITVLAIGARSRGRTERAGIGRRRSAENP